MKANMFRNVGAAVVRLGGAVGASVALAAAPVPAAVSQIPPLQVCPAFGLPCKLSVGLDDARVIDPVLAPNGGRVVLIHLGENLLVDLYSVPVAGGRFPVKLTVSSEESARFVAISPDSTRVLYTLPAGTGEPGDPVRRELFSVPIAGPSSASVKLAADISTATRVRVSPDSRKVVFAPPAGDRLRVVPIAGPASAGQRLTDPFVAGGRVDEFRISANSGSVVYRADQDTDGVSELYRVPLTLSPAPDPLTTKLNGPLAPGGDVDQFTLVPNNGPVVYLADQDTDAVRELYRVGLGGAGRAKLNRTLPSGWNVFSPNEAPGEDDLPARVLPDGSRVVYEIGDVVNGRVFHEFYSVPIAGPGSASVRLDHPPLIPPGEIFALDYTISADSKRVVYTMVDQSLPGEPNLPPVWLLSVPAAGPASASRALTFPATAALIHTLSPDSQRVAYIYQDNLLSVPIAGGTSVRLNGTENLRGAFLRINATSTRVAYEARTVTGDALFSAPLDGSGTRYNLTESLEDAWDVTGRALTPSGTRVIYRVRRGDLDAPVELFSSELVPGVLPPTP